MKAYGNRKPFSRLQDKLGGFALKEFLLKAWTITKPYIGTLIMLVVGHFAIVYIVYLLKKILARSPLDASLAKFIRKTVNISLHVILLLMVLSSLGISTTGLLAAVSAVAVGVGVALKDSLSNIAGGILLLVSPRFVTGDYIESEGDGGTVLNVDLLHTTVRTPDGRQVSIPNGVLINSHIVNYSREKYRRVELNFSVPYSADVEVAKELALQTVINHPLVEKEEPDKPFVRVGGYEEGAVRITIRAWCESQNYFTAYFDLLESIRLVFQENGIEIPFKQLDVHIHECENNK